MLPRTRMLRTAILVLALLGPIFHLAGILSRGVSLLYGEYTRVGFTYAVLALSAGAAAYLALKRMDLVVRLIAGAALLVNLASIAYVASTWSRDIKRALDEIEMTPVETGRVGIVVSPSGLSSSALIQARALQDLLNEIIEQTDSQPYIAVRHGHPVSTAEQAARLGVTMRSNIVVWKEEVGSDWIREKHHVTVLGANETEIDLQPVSLMLLMATQGTFTIGGSRLADEKSPHAMSVTAPVAAGFGFLAIGQPMLAAAQFQRALKATGVPTDSLPALHNYFGTALLFLDRPDLAEINYRESNQIEPNAPAWAGLGSAALATHDWYAAAEAFEQALVLDPYYVPPYCGRGVILARERNVSRAISSYRQAIALAPEGGVPHAFLGTGYELAADVEAAQDAYRRAAENAGPNEGLRIAALDRAEHILRYPPTAIPTATPPPVPTTTPIPPSRLYHVQQGDTLQAIADELGVAVKEIVDLNELKNPDALAIGQALIIPKRR